MLNDDAKQIILADFCFSLRPEQRKNLGIEKNLCEKGKKMFEDFCNDPLENKDFVLHITVLQEYGKCQVCEKAFFGNLVLELD